MFAFHILKQFCVKMQVLWIFYEFSWSAKLPEAIVQKKAAMTQNTPAYDTKTVLQFWVVCNDLKAQYKVHKRVT